MFYSKSFKPFVSVVLFLLVVAFSTTTRAQGGGMGAGMGAADPHATTEELNAAIDALQAQIEQLTASPGTISVDCGIGESINDAITSAINRNALITIAISGSCNEAVAIRNRIVSFVQEAGGLQAAIAPIGGGAPRPALIVGLLARVTMNGVNLTGPPNSTAVWCSDGSNLHIQNSDIDSSGEQNSLVTASENANCEFTNVTIDGKNLARNGIRASRGANVILNGSTVQNMSGLGFSVESGAKIHLGWSLPNSPTSRAPTLIQYNGAGGFVSTNGTVTAQHVTVQGNLTDGLRMQSGAALTVFPGAAVIVTGNGSNGVTAWGNVSGSFFSNDMEIIANNTSLEPNTYDFNCYDDSFAVAGNNGTVGTRSSNCPAIGPPVSLEIDGFAVTCADPLITQEYYIDDVSNPPQVVPGSHPDSFSIVSGVLPSGDQITLALIGNLGNSQNEFQNCTSPPEPDFLKTPDPNGLGAMAIRGASGAQWLARYELRRDATSLSITDIIITRD